MHRARLPRAFARLARLASTPTSETMSTMRVASTPASAFSARRAHATNRDGQFNLVSHQNPRRARVGTATRAASGSSKTSGKTAYVCEECGHDARQWYGQCPGCKTWDSMKIVRGASEPSGATSASAKSGGGAGARAVARMVETTTMETDGTSIGIGGRARRGGGRAKSGWVAEANAPRALVDVLRPKTNANGEMRGAMPRMRLREDLGREIERVLGGGVVPGGMTLVGGDPGVGKSTILLQLAGLLARGGKDVGEEDGVSGLTGGVLYASGEESVEQVAGRAERMGVNADGIYLYSATRLENILDAVAKLKPSALVVDSIQTVFLEDATGSPGSVSQVRECATALLHAAKTTGMPVFIVGHVTKSGDIAGPRVLEHIVDVVLYLEGDADRAVRILRGHKNRYGSTDEVGVFQMSDDGLTPVASPSALFLGERVLSPDVSAAPTVTVQGSRPFMLEVQALTNERAESGEGGMTAPPIRTAVGLRFERMQLLLAVLAKFVLGRRVQKHDVFINIVGGMKLDDPSTDVAIALAIASSFVEKPLPPDMCFFGEVGLGGELRPVMQAERRIAEAATMGFKRVLLPEAGSSPEMGKKTGIELVRCNTLAEALEAALDVKPSRSAMKTQPKGSWPSKFPKQKRFG